MKPMIWDTSMSVGIEALDEDHRTILNAITRLSRAIDKRQPQPVIDALLGALFSSVDRHLRREEHLMERLRHFGLAPHTMAHDVFRRWMADFRYHFNEEPCPNSEDKFLKFLWRWWMGHIRDCDMQYKAEFVRRKEEVESILDELDETEPRHEAPSPVSSKGTVYGEKKKRYLGPLPRTSLP